MVAVIIGRREFILTCTHGKSWHAATGDRRYILPEAAGCTSERRLWCIWKRIYPCGEESALRAASPYRLKKPSAGRIALPIWVYRREFGFGDEL